MFVNRAGPASRFGGRPRLLAGSRSAVPLRRRLRQLARRWWSIASRCRCSISSATSATKPGRLPRPASPGRRFEGQSLHRRSRARAIARSDSSSRGHHHDTAERVDHRAAGVPRTQASANDRERYSCGGRWRASNRSDSCSRRHPAGPGGRRGTGAGGPRAGRAGGPGPGGRLGRAAPAQTGRARWPIRIGWSRSGRRSATIRSGAAIGIIPDGKGGTWLHHRSEPPIIHFDASGKIVQELRRQDVRAGARLLPDRDGNFWAGDSGPFADNPATAGRGFQMFKFSPEGKVLLTLGKAGVSKAGDRHLHRADRVRDRAERRHRRSPTATGRGRRRRSRTAIASSAITKDGKFVGEYGKLGTGPGEFMGPHALAFDSQGRLFVADRSNNRVQIFDRDMKFVDEWRHFGRPSGVAILKDDTLDRRPTPSRTSAIGGPPQAPEGGGNAVRNPGWRNGIRIGSAKDGSLQSLHSGHRARRHWPPTNWATSSAA